MVLNKLKLNMLSLKKLGLNKWSLLCLLVLSANVQAENTAKLLVYIHPQEYSNSIKLWQYYQDYWFNQGPVVEEVAKDLLGKAFHDVGMCDSNQRASNTLVWLRPRMFYNPEMQMYHSKLTAVVYEASGKPIATYEGVGVKHGYLDVFPAKQVKATYALAMNDLVQKMQADPALAANLDKPVTTDNATPCSLVTLLPAPKIQFMSF